MGRTLGTEAALALKKLSKPDLNILRNVITEGTVKTKQRRRAAALIDAGILSVIKGENGDSYSLTPVGRLHGITAGYIEAKKAPTLTKAQTVLVAALEDGPVKLARGGRRYKMGLAMQDLGYCEVYLDDSADSVGAYFARKPAAEDAAADLGAIQKKLNEADTSVADVLAAADLVVVAGPEVDAAPAASQGNGNESKKSGRKLTRPQTEQEAPKKKTGARATPPKGRKPAAKKTAKKPVAAPQAAGANEVARLRNQLADTIVALRSAILGSDATLAAAEGASTKRTPIASDNGELAGAIVTAMLHFEEGAKAPDLVIQVGSDKLTIRAELVAMEKLGIVYRTGKTRGTRWYIG